MRQLQKSDGIVIDTQLGMYKMLIYILVILNIHHSSYALNCEKALFESNKLAVAKIIYTRSVIKNSFTTSRALTDYQYFFGNSFKNDLDNLTESNIWIDFGAGKAIAAEDYLTNQTTKEKATVYAITYKYNRWFSSYKGPKLIIKKNKLFEEYEEIPKYDLGTDVFGIFSYTQHIDHYLDKSLNYLKLNGKLYITADFNTMQILKKTGQHVSIVDWLKNLEGIKVDIVNSGAIVITKLLNNIIIPELEISWINQDILPPPRLFKEK